MIHGKRYMIFSPLNCLVIDCRDMLLKDMGTSLHKTPQTKLWKLEQQKKKKDIQSSLLILEQEVTSVEGYRHIDNWTVPKLNPFM